MSRELPSMSTESERRSMLMFRPSSSTCRFSSRVPNRASIFEVSSMLFFIQCWQVPPGANALLNWQLLDDTRRAGELHSCDSGLYFATCGRLGNSSVKSLPPSPGDSQQL